jgi:toxin ParE1/3/4
MKPVVFDLEAMDEVRDAVAFMNGGWPGLGDRFEAEVERATDLIGRQPKAFSPYADGFRKYVLTRFGYVLIYFEFDAFVWVATVHHGSRDPNYWRQRQPPQ